jgi:putative NADH-flavin reductase
MTIALFGATGKTGREVLSKLLKKGYTVRALAREPQRLKLNHSSLEVIGGDVLNIADVQRVVKGVDAVISLFGHVKGSPEHLQTDGTKNIVQAMNEEGVDRIISLSGGGLPFPSKDKPKLPDKMIRLIMRVFVPKVLNDAIDHAEVLGKSDLRWTIVRGPRLTMEPEKGNYRVGWVGVNASTSIGRADLADFIVNQVEDVKYVGKMPFVSY